MLGVDPALAEGGRPCRQARCTRVPLTSIAVQVRLWRSTGPDQEAFVNDWIDRTIAIGDEVRLRIGGPCPRSVTTTLPQETCQGIPASYVPRLSTTRRTSVYAVVIAGEVMGRGDRFTPG
jgi:hypothetical protein